MTRSLAVRAFLATLEKKAPQEAFTWAEILNLFPAADPRFLRETLEALVASGDMICVGARGSKAWTLLTPLVNRCPCGQMENTDCAGECGRELAP